MQLENGKLVMGMQNCHNCKEGQVPGQIRCLTCKGTGSGKRGGRGRCPTCHGSGVNYSFDLPVQCHVCKGNFQNFEPETIYDRLPNEIYQALEFKVYRHYRPLTGNESLLGANCIYASADYGTAWKNDDESTIREVKQHGCHQACHVVHPETHAMPSHIGIFIGPQGYSVRPVFEHVALVILEIAMERPENDYLHVGAEMACAGRNGTAEALYR